MIATLADKGRADSIAVNCGPGSFTGIRVGLSAAMALGIAWKIPVKGYSTLALVAHMAARSGAHGAISIAMQAGHGELFVQNFTISHGVVQADEDSSIVSLQPGDAARLIGERNTFGSGIAMLAETIASNEGQFILPDARAFPADRGDFAALPPKPIYVRAPDAKPVRINDRVSPQMEPHNG